MAKNKACEEWKEAMLKVLKLQGVVQLGVQELDPEGETPLVRAASDGIAAEDLLLLIEAGAAVNERTRTGSNPLSLAAQYGQVEAANLLIECKAEIDAASTVSS